MFSAVRATVRPSASRLVSRRAYATAPAPGEAKEAAANNSNTIYIVGGLAAVGGLWYYLTQTPEGNKDLKDVKNEAEKAGVDAKAKAEELKNKLK